MSLQAIINTIKAFIPASVWRAARSAWYKILDLIYSASPRVRSINYCGLTLYFNRGSSIINRLKNEPIFEEKMCASIEKELLRGDTNPIFIDVGANLGLILSYVLCKIPTVQIYAFEPGPTQRELLEMTIKKNYLSEKVIVYPEGLGQEPGEAIFQTHDPRYVSGDGFIDTGRAREARTIKVEVTTLDVWWSSQNFPKVTVVKIDTEGAELWVLRGAVKMLAEVSPVIYLEIEPKNLKVYPHNHIDILDFLNENHYQLFTLDDVKITKDNFADYIGKDDTYIGRPVKKPDHIA